MATIDTYKIARYGDRKWIDTFLNAIREGLIEQAHFSGISGISQIDVTNPDELPELLQFFREKNAASLKNATSDIRGLSISLARVDTPLNDELKFTWNQSSRSPTLSDEERAKIVVWFTSNVLHLDPERGLFSGADISEVANNELALHNAIFERLEALQVKLAEDTASFNKQIQDNYFEEKQKLDAQFGEDRAKLSKEFEAKNQALAKRSEDLDQREAGIDALDNTAARRQIRKDLLEELQRRSDEFVLTSGTKRLRWPVHIVSLAIIATGLAGAYFFGSKLPDLDETNSINYAIALAKPFGLSFAAIGTAFFYLRWLNRWFEQHAQAEFKLKQFQLDIERASWLVETALEWDGSEGKELPQKLLESLARNLFNVDDDKVDQVRHPVDELASALLGSASKIRLNLGGNEVELDGKRLKKATLDPK